MEEFNKNIEGIRRMMSELRDEKYSIVNQDLVSLDEYMKTLYLKILCTVIQLGDEPTEMQILFLKRIVNGIGVDDPAEEYMRRALEISDTDMKEFLIGMKENRAKYYFALDGLILVSVGTENQECYQYLAEIIELMDICKVDLEYVCLVASSVLQQQSSLYDSAKALTNERIREVDYTPYIQNYYTGAIQDSVKLVHYSAPDKKYSNSVELRTYYREKKVIFENLNININETWKFNQCEEVIFKNCNIEGSSFGIEIYGCEKVVICQCRVYNFRVPVIQLAYNEEIVIDECEFENCIGKVTATWADEMSGGVILAAYSKSTKRNTIRKTIFKNCGGLLNPYEKIIAISNLLCDVSDCRFYNCHHYGGSGDHVIDCLASTLFREETTGSNNELFNSIKFC